MALINPTFPTVGQIEWGELLNGDLQTIVDLVNRHEMTAVGVGATAAGPAGIAVGQNSAATFSGAIAIGQTAQATTGSAVAVGVGASAANSGAAFGALSIATGSNTVAIGGATATGNVAIAIGTNARATIANGIALGSNALADKAGTVVVAAYSNSTTFAQAVEMVQRQTSTNATAQNRTFATADAALTRFTIQVTARQRNAPITHAWSVTGYTEKVGGVMRMIGTPTVTSVYAETGSEAWAVAVSVEPTNTGVRVSCTGAVATNIEWALFCRSEESRYSFTNA